MSNIARDKRSRAIDRTLESIDSTLSVASDAANFLPVAGVGVVIPIIRLIVEQFRVRTLTALIRSVVISTSNG